MATFGKPNQTGRASNADWRITMARWRERVTPKGAI
jgi:hypothetical protein